jgi:hypothetical protein
MNETIWLRVDRYGVKAMTKSMPSRLNKGEYPVKINLEVKPEAFREPLMETDIVITDWRQGFAFPDIDLKEMAITKEEADQLIAQREAQAVEDLRKKGYDITPPAKEPDNA